MSSMCMLRRRFANYDEKKIGVVVILLLQLQ